MHGTTQFGIAWWGTCSHVVRKVSVLLLIGSSLLLEVAPPSLKTLILIHTIFASNHN